VVIEVQTLVRAAPLPAAGARWFGVGGKWCSECIDVGTHGDCCYGVGERLGEGENSILGERS
jgi:hypothetical protein